MKMKYTAKNACINGRVNVPYNIEYELIKHQNAHSMHFIAAWL
jgi:hypothetical protein